MSSSSIPKAGTIIELDNGVTLKVVANLAQILTGEDSCKGCYFDVRNEEGVWPEGRCDLGRTSHPLLVDMCVDYTADIELQVIYIKEE